MSVVYSGLDIQQYVSPIVHNDSHVFVNLRQVMFNSMREDERLEKCVKISAS